MKVTKAQADALRHHAEAIALARADVDGAFRMALREIWTALKPVNARLDAYNEVVAQAQAFVEDVAGELRDAYEERSDQWRESEAGQAADALICAWENVDLDLAEPVTILLPDPPALAPPLDLPTEDS